MSVTIQDENSSLLDALQSRITSLFVEPTIEKITAILDSGVSLEDLLYYNGRNLFISSCTWGKPEIVEFLLDKGVSVFEADNNGRNSLMHMANNASYNQKIVGLLLNNGLKINQQENEGMTAIMFFAQGQGSTGKHKGNLTAVMHLIRCGADLYMEDCKGRTILDHARMANERSKNSSNQEIVDMLHRIMRPYYKLREIEQVEQLSASNKKSLMPDTKIGPRTLEDQIEKIERFKVRITNENRQVRSDCLQFTNYSRTRATNGNKTVAAWKKKFIDSYPDFDVEVLKNNNDVAGVATLLRTLRN